MTNKAYERLREFYDRLPGGFPKTDSGLEIRILQKMYTPEEAEVVSYMGTMPEPASEIAKRAGRDTSEILEQLEVIAKRGHIWKIPMGDKPLFMALSFLIGTWEMQLYFNGDREFAEMANAYFPYLAKEWASLKTQQTRVIPVNSAIESSSIVKPYDQIRELAATQDKFAVTRCTCSIDAELLDGKCDYPEERCVTFGIQAEMMITINLGREISREEFLSLLDMGEEKGLVLNVNNSKDLYFLCMCCHCCCVLLKMLRYGGNPADQVQSSFYAQIDPDACIACGSCEERCQIEAVIAGEPHKIDASRCLGCGLCISTCQGEAITLIAKPDVTVNDTYFETMRQIMEERGAA